MRVPLVAALLMAASMAGCSAFTPQRDIAVVCGTAVTQNAAVLCVKYSYASIRDAATVASDRFASGRLSSSGLRTVAAVLDSAYRATATAETAVLAGDLATAQGRLAAVSELLLQVEEALR